MPRQRVRNAANEAAAWLQHAPNLLQRVVWVHQMLESLKAQNQVKRIVGKREAFRTDVEAESPNTGRNASFDSRRGSIHADCLQFTLFEQLQQRPIPATDFKYFTDICAGQEFFDGPCQSMIIIGPVIVIIAVRFQRDLAGIPSML